MKKKSNIWQKIFNANLKAKKKINLKKGANANHLKKIVFFKLFFFFGF